MKFLKILSFTAMAVAFSSQAYALDIQQEQINQCVQGVTHYKIADNATAKKLCSCTINVRMKMTIGQMWEIESYAQSGKDPSTLPYAKKFQQDLQQCTVGLKLNPPQKPN